MDVGSISSWQTIAAPVYTGTVVDDDPRPLSAMENVRLLVERNRNGAGTGRAAAASVHTVGIVGAGTMGTEIAAAHLKRRLPVTIADASENAVRTARARLVDELSADVPRAEAEQVVRRFVRTPTSGNWLGTCDLVIETINEDLAQKTRLYAQVEPWLAPHAILASNTSTIPIRRLAARLADPARFCGLHFCHPVRSRPLVEVIGGPGTADNTTATVVAHARAIGGMPLMVGDGHGFVVNRLLFAYLGEALDLLLEGAELDEVERAMIEFGMAMGPFQAIDEIGLDTALRAALVLSEVFEDRIARSPLLVGMIKAGRLGRKSGGGFLAVADRRSDDNVLSRMIARWGREKRKHTPRAIQVRLLLPMVLEAVRLLEEGKVGDPRDIDLASIFGLGFPDRWGGLLWWAERIGLRRIPCRELPKRAELRYADE